MNNQTHYLAVVEDRNDPERMGRVRVRVFGIHVEDKEEIPTEMLPWASVLMPPTSASISGVGETHALSLGSWVLVTFLDGESKQMPLVLGSIYGLPLKKPDTEKGFCDQVQDHPMPPEAWEFAGPELGIINEPSPPDGFPRENYLGEPSVNRLARWVPEGIQKKAIDTGEKIETEISEIAGPEVPPLVETKLLLREQEQVDIPSATGYILGVPYNIGLPWEEPEPAWASVYPHNKVTETESGHVIEIDDTPGAERIHVWHRSGSFIEIQPDGTVVSKTAGHNVRLVMRDENVHVEGDLRLTVDRGARILINKDNLPVQDLNIEIGSGGSCNLTVQQGNCNLNVLNGNLHKMINGNVVEIITGNYVQFIGASAIKMIGQYRGNVVGLVDTNVVGKYGMDIAGLVKTDGAGIANVNVGGLFNFTVSLVWSVVLSLRVDINPIPL